MVSGYGKFEEIADVNCKVVVEAGEMDAGKVKQIIRDMGKDLESPNLKKPKFKNDQEIMVYNELNEARKSIDKEEKGISLNRSYD